MALTLLYWPALGGPFLLDDAVNLERSRVEGWSLSELWHATGANESGPLGRPIAAFSFGLNYMLFGERSLSFKVTNLALHAMNTLLVIALCCSMARISSNDYIRRNAGSLAVAVGLLWSVHPLHVSTVMYVVQRMTLLATLFSLASMLAYVEGRRAQIERRSGQAGWFLTVPFFFLLSLFSKESGALVPVFLVIIEVLLFRCSLDGRVADPRLRAAVIASILIAFISTVAVLAITPESVLDGYAQRDFTLGERLLTEPGVVLSYAADFLAPWTASFALYQDSWPIQRNVDPSTIFAFAGVVLVAVAAYLCRRVAPLIGLGLALFLASQLLESSVVALELRFEHRAYLGTIGLSLAGVTALAYLFSRPHASFTRGAAVVLTGCLVLGLCWQTHSRAWTWHDELSLNTHEVATNPSSLRARSALAISLSRAGRAQESLEQLEAAMRLDPLDTYLPLAALQVMGLAGLYDPQALQATLRTLQRGVVTMDTVNVLNDMMVNNRLGLFEGLGEPQMLAVAIGVANRLPSRVGPVGQAVVLAHLSELLMGNEQYEDALRAAEAAVLADPGNTELLLRRTELQTGLGRIDAAQLGLEELLALDLSDRSSRERMEAIRDRLRSSATDSEPSG